MLDKHKDMGTIVMGKTKPVRSGAATSSVMLNNVKVTVAALFRDDVETSKILPGENVRLRLNGTEEEAPMSGFVLCAPNAPVHVTRRLRPAGDPRAPEHKSIFTAGYKAVIHIHAVTEECEVTKIVHEIDGKTRKPKGGRRTGGVLKSGSPRR